MAKRLVSRWLLLCNAAANPTCHPLARGHGCGLLYARRLMTKRFLILNSQLWIIDCLFCQGGAKGVYTWIIVRTAYCNLQIFNCKLWFVNCQLIPLPRGRWEILIERFIQWKHYKHSMKSLYACNGLGTCMYRAKRKAPSILTEPFNKTNGAFR